MNFSFKTVAANPSKFEEFRVEIKTFKENIRKGGDIFFSPRMAIHSLYEAFFIDTIISLLQVPSRDHLSEKEAKTIMSYDRVQPDYVRVYIIVAYSAHFLRQR